LKGEFKEFLRGNGDLRPIKKNKILFKNEFWKIENTKKLPKNILIIIPRPIFDHLPNN